MTGDGPIQVLVVGGGVGGLAAAAALVDAGLEPVVVESAETDDEGADAVELWPEAISILDDLGIAGGVRDASAAVDAWTERRPDGTVTRRLEADGVGPVAVPYGTLRVRLREALPPDAVRTGRTVRSVETKGDRAVAAFANGVREPFDAVVGADGARSRTRRALCGRTLVDCGTRTWTFPVPSWPHGDEIAEGWTAEEVVFRVLPARRGGTGRLTLPTDGPSRGPGGRRPGTDLDDARSVVEWLRPTAPADPHAERIRVASDVRLPTPVWGARRVAFVGDAAHARSRLAGVGPTLAVEDAAALATALSGGEGPVRSRIADYAARRDDRFDRLESRSPDTALLPDSTAAVSDGTRSAAEVRAVMIDAAFADRRDSG